jgi:hypothetical protein
MWTRLLACSMLMCVGCATRTERERTKPPAKSPTSADGPSVTLYVEGMTQRLNLT